jgi:hypothetical protein
MLTNLIVFVSAGAIPYPCLLPRPKRAVSNIPITRAMARRINKISDFFTSPSSGFGVWGLEYRVWCLETIGSGGQDIFGRALF